MLKSMLGLTLCQIGLCAASAGAQECAAGRADEDPTVVVDTVEWNVEDAFEAIMRGLAELGYEIATVDEDAHLVSTAPYWETPPSLILRSFRGYPPPGIEFAVLVEAGEGYGVPESVMITYAARAICRIDRPSPDGIVATPENVFEAAAVSSFGTWLVFASPHRPNRDE